MLNDYQSVDGLINGIKGTTNFLSSLLSRKFGLIILFVVFGVIISKILI